MLRGLQAAYLSPILQAYQINVSGASAASSVLNGQDLSGVTASSTIGTATHKLLSRRDRLMMATPVASTYAYACHNASATTSVVTAVSRDTGGTAATGKANIFALGFDHPSTLRIRPYSSVKGMNSFPRIVTGYIKSDGTVLAGGRNILSVSLASSVYTITLKRAFGRTPVVLAGCWHATTHKCATVHTEGVRTFKIATWGDGSAEDNYFYFIAMGWDLPQTNYGMRRSIRMSAIQPRLEFFHVTQSAGTYTCAKGNGTLTKNATGDVKVAFPKAFKRAPMCIAIAKTGRASLKAVAATTDATVRLYTAASHNTLGDDDFYLLALGWDSVVEL